MSKTFNQECRELREALEQLGRDMRRHPPFSWLFNLVDYLTTPKPKEGTIMATRTLQTIDYTYNGMIYQLKGWDLEEDKDAMESFMVLKKHVAELEAEKSEPASIALHNYEDGSRMVDNWGQNPVRVSFSKISPFKLGTLGFTTSVMIEPGETIQLCGPSKKQSEPTAKTAKTAEEIIKGQNERIISLEVDLQKAEDKERGLVTTIKELQAKINLAPFGSGVDAGLAQIADMEKTILIQAGQLGKRDRRNHCLEETIESICRQREHYKQEGREMEKHIRKLEQDKQKHTHSGGPG